MVMLIKQLSGSWLSKGNKKSFQDLGTETNFLPLIHLLNVEVNDNDNNKINEQFVMETLGVLGKHRLFPSVTL